MSCCSSFVTAQVFDLSEEKQFEKVKFQLINNLIVIPIEVNGTELSFILDSGVSAPILFNIADQDSIQINEVSEVTINGLGDGEPIKALRSKHNRFKMGAVKNDRQQLYVILDKSLNLSPSIGIPIHGIIGYELFRDFVVDINYKAKYIKFYPPKSYQRKQRKRSQTLPLSLSNKKAYVKVAVYIDEKGNIPVKMLIDTGSSDAIWLHENETIGIPEKNYEDFLGRGLGGDIFGKRTKVANLKIGDFVLEDAKAAFPDKNTYGAISNLGNRNGSIGGEVLKRFNIIFDYSRNEITLRKNRNFKTPFHYNLSGIALQHNGVRYVVERITDNRKVVIENNDNFGDVQILMENTTRLSLVPEIVVSGIRAGSPAADAGLKEGDVILAVNGKRIHKYKLQQVLQMLNKNQRKRIRVLIERYNSDMLLTFELRDLFK